MPIKGGRREREKVLRFQIGVKALDSNRDPSPLFLELTKLQNKDNLSNYPTKNTYRLIKIDFEPKIVYYKDIPKNDPRRKPYKLRYIFGQDPE